MPYFNCRDLIYIALYLCPRIEPRTRLISSPSAKFIPIKLLRFDRSHRYRDLRWDCEFSKVVDKITRNSGDFSPAIEAGKGTHTDVIFHRRKNDLASFFMEHIMLSSGDSIHILRRVIAERYKNDTFLLTTTLSTFYRRLSTLTSFDF